MDREQVDIAVVGAGPVGLAAALLLDRLGYRVALIAPAIARADHRTSALLSGSVRLLDRIGVWETASKAAAPLRSLRIVDATGRLIRSPEVIFHAGEIDLEAFGYNIPNSALVEALEARLQASGVLRISAMVDDIRFPEERVAVSLSDGSAISTLLVAGADGRASKTRQAAEIGTREWRYDQSALVANLRHSRPHECTSTEFHTPTGPMTFVPLEGQRSSLVWVGSRAETDYRAALDEADFVKELEERSSWLLGDLEIEGGRQTFPLSGLNAESFAGRRTVLLGEAAHLFPPIGAQGLNLGYRDVSALGKILARRRPDPGKADVTSAYDRARRSDVFLRTTAVDALNRSLLNGFLPVQGVRGLGLFMLDRVPVLRRALMKQGVAASF